jgi:hypothetical protein
MNGTPASPATARASSVLPVPVDSNNSSSNDSSSSSGSVSSDSNIQVCLCCRDQCVQQARETAVRPAVPDRYCDLQYRGTAVDVAYY